MNNQNSQNNQSKQNSQNDLVTVHVVDQNKDTVLPTPAQRVESVLLGAIADMKNVQELQSVVDTVMTKIRDTARAETMKQLRSMMDAGGLDSSDLEMLLSHGNGTGRTAAKVRYFLSFELNGKTYGVHRGKGKASGLLADAIEQGQTLADMKAKGEKLNDRAKGILESHTKQVLEITEYL